MFEPFLFKAAGRLVDFMPICRVACCGINTDTLTDNASTSEKKWHSQKAMRIGK